MTHNWTSETIPGRLRGSKLVALPDGFDLQPMTPQEMAAKWQAAMDEAASWQRWLSLSAVTSATVSAEPPSCDQLREALRLANDSLAVARQAKADADEAARVAAQASQRLAGAIATLQGAITVIMQLMQDAGCVTATEPPTDGPVPMSADADLHMGEP